MAAIFKMAVNEFFLKIIENTIKMLVFYPTGVREGIYCDLLAITTLNLVIIISPNTKVRGYIVFAEFLIIIILIISPNTKCRGYIVFAPFLIIIIIIIIFLSSVLSELFRE